MTFHKRKILLLLFPVLCFPLFQSFESWAENPETIADQVQKPVRRSIDIRQQTQQIEDEWAAEKEKHIARYEALARENERLAERAADLDQQITIQGAKNVFNRAEIEKIDALTDGLAPLLEQLVLDLEQRMDSDLPFLMEERRERITRLKALCADRDAPAGETYRRVMEAFLVEAEYGQTIEVYPETVPVNGTDMQVRVFRLGRVSLFFQTPDGGFSGYYDVAAREWKRLPGKYGRVLGEAMEMGARRRPVELLSLPLGRMAVQ